MKFPIFRMKQNDVTVGKTFTYSVEYLDDLSQDDIEHFRISNDIQSDLHERLCDCIRFHQILNECCNRMEAVNNPFALIKVLEISIQICVLALSILKVSFASI